MVAVNDGIVLESCIYKLLKNHFRARPYYADLVDLFHEVLDYVYMFVFDYVCICLSALPACLPVVPTPYSYTFLYIPIHSCTFLYIPVHSCTSTSYNNHMLHPDDILDCTRADAGPHYCTHWHGTPCCFFPYVHCVVLPYVHCVVSSHMYTVLYHMCCCYHQ